MDGESRVDAGNLIIVERLLTVLADIVRVVWYEWQTIIITIAD